VEDVLPLEIEPVYDDRVERPEGGAVTLTDAEHYVTDHLDAGSVAAVPHGLSLATTRWPDCAVTRPS
jgi:uncharacterized membrane protein